MLNAENINMRKKCMFEYIFQWWCIKFIIIYTKSTRYIIIYIFMMDTKIEKKENKLFFDINIQLCICIFHIIHLIKL